MLVVGRLRPMKFFVYSLNALARENRYSKAMAKTQPSEFFSTLKSYAQKLSDGERTPAEVATALNDWAKESADSVKGRIHDEVESAVLKMGFVKREEFDELAAEVKRLKKAHSKKSDKKKSDKRKSDGKKSATKKKESKK